MYTLSQSIFSDQLVTLNGEEFFELQDHEAFKNSIAFRFVFSAPGDAILFCSQDNVDGCAITFDSGRITLKCFQGGTLYTLQSNVLDYDTLHFVEIIANISTGDSVLFVDGVDQKYSSDITGLTDISNDESFKIGGTNQISYGSGINTIGLFSFSTVEDWFSTDISGFESEYNNYILNKINPNFPYGGPNAYQMIDESSQSYLQTPPGTDNLQDDITIDGLNVSPIVNFNAKNYVDDTTTVDDFDIVRVSGTDPVYEYLSKYAADEAAKLDAVTYLSKQNPYVGAYGDFVIETVFKCYGDSGTSYLFGCGNYAGDKQISLTIDNVGGSAQFKLTDSNSLIQSYSFPNSTIDTNDWNHLVFIVRRSGSISGYVNGVRISTSSGAPSLGTIYDSANEMYIGKAGSQSSDDDIFVTMLNIWEQFEWLSESRYDDFVDDRYSKYINGGENYLVPIPMTIYTWGDDTGTYPMVMTLDKNGVWNLQLVGSAGSTVSKGEFTVDDGMYGIRLFSKFEEDGYSNFDDIQSQLASIEKIQIPKRFKRSFERIVNQTKPLGTWTIMMVEWV